jgi:hypothetical protein
LTRKFVGVFCAPFQYAPPTAAFIMSSLIACNEKKEVAMSPADKDAIKLKFKRWKTLCCAYNARNPDEILYYADDAISSSNEKIH